MNLPSLDKFVDSVVPGGTILVDSSMIDKKVERTDVNVYYIDATRIANEQGLKGCAIIILVGKMFKEVGFCTKEALDKGIQKVIPAKKAAMLGLNQEALKIGMES
jgi:2-oxoglutarate ferredoxin oxidoreductase subunit gamma